MIKKAIAILIVITMSIGLLAGCGSSTQSNSASMTKNTGKKITLNVWYTYPVNNSPGSEDHMLKEIAKNYMKLHPNIKVNMVGNASLDKTLTALVGGQGPDIFLNLWPNIPDWSSKGALLDLTSYVNNDKAFDKNDILPSAWKLATYKDKIYGIPNEVSSSEIYYNKDLLKAAGFDGPPQTMEDLISMAEKLTKVDANGNIQQLGFLPDFPWLDNVVWPVVFGAYWIDEKTNKITFDTPEMAAAYKWQADIYKKYGVDKLNKFKSGFGSDAQDPFLTGKLAMQFAGEWVIGNAAKYAPNLHYGIAPMPYPKDHPELKGASFITAPIWNISAKSKYKDEAWKLLSFITGKDSMKLFANGDGTGKYLLMSRVSVLNTLSDKAPQELKAVAKMIQSPSIRSFPMLPYTNQYLTIINDEMTKVLAQKEPLQDALKVVQQKAQALADQNPINK